MIAECFFHGPEDDEGAYLACGECYHVYRTRWHFRWALLRRVGEDFRYAGPRVGTRAAWDALTRPLSTVASCPLCTHDL